MVEGTDEELEQFKDLTYTQKPEQSYDIEYSIQASDKDSDDVLLFFSFDIVNSTLYKTINNYKWVHTIDKILKAIKDEIKEKIKIAEVWRVFGDEIIFIANISDKEKIGEYISHIHKVLIEFSDSIGNYENLKEQSDEGEIGFIGQQSLISLQACAWIAAVTDISKIKEDSEGIFAENIFEIFEEGPNNKFREFRGVDIDTGFRLAKETVTRRLTVSFELAYFLSEIESVSENIRVIAYKKLKGVWKNLSYPIIWYYDNNHNGKCSFEDSIPFDAVAQEGIYADLIAAELYKKNKIEEIKELLNKILKERGLQKKIDKLKKLIAYKSGNSKGYLKDSKLELHCVAVCYNEEGKILIVKRAGEKLLPTMWEFGCAKASYDKSISDVLKEEYKNDFGIDIELYFDENRKVDKQPVPLAVYTIEKNNEFHKGIIFIAKIISNTEIKLNNKKHSEFKFINSEELENGEVEEDNLVPDAIDTMYKAFEIIKGIRNENKS